MVQNTQLFATRWPADKDAFAMRSFTEPENHRDRYVDGQVDSHDILYHFTPRLLFLITLVFTILLYPVPAAKAAAAELQLQEFQVTIEDDAPIPSGHSPISPGPQIPQPTPFPADWPESFTAWPPLAEDGFLGKSDTNAQTEFIYADEEAGIWIYLTDVLRIHISRISARVERRDVIWFIADIRFKSPEAFRAYSANPKSPGRGSARPEVIAKQHSMVYAQNGDLFTYRVSNKERAGIIIRNGKILHENTYTRAHAIIPPLDELSLYPDGHIEMHTPGQMRAQDYLNKGATDVLSFGPILFKDRVKDDRLDKSFTSLEPRSALGVIGPGHFVGIMVEGRNKRSGGAPLRFVADRLLEAGCMEAFTLDGGQTAAMIFMGKNVMDPGIYSGYHKTRSQPDIIGIGVSEAVPKK